MKKYVITVNGTKYEVEVEEAGFASSKAAPAPAPRPVEIERPVAQKTETSAPSAGSTKKVTAPMPGNILKVNVRAGDVVKKGQSLLILEAMKMENDIVSPFDGKVSAVKAEKGKAVAVGDLLVSIEG